MSEVTIYHNPRCGTSRNVLAMIRNAGIEPRIVPYLETPPSRDELLALVAATGQPVLDLLPRPQQGVFAKEDGEQVVDARGRRVA